MESWIKKQQFGQLPFDFDELEMILAELVEEVLEVEKIDLEKPIEINFALKCDETGCLRIESIGNKFASISQIILPNETLSSVSENQAQVVFTIELPNIKRNELFLQVANGKLLIFAGKAGQIKKEFILSPNIEQAISKSTFKNGILEVALNKKF